jgi:hypothetical protein
MKAHKLSRRVFCCVRVGAGSVSAGAKTRVQISIWFLARCMLPCTSYLLLYCKSCLQAPSRYNEMVTTRFHLFLVRWRSYYRRRGTHSFSLTSESSTAFYLLAGYATRRASTTPAFVAVFSLLGMALLSPRGRHVDKLRFGAVCLTGDVWTRPAAGLRQNVMAHALHQRYSCIYLQMCAFVVLSERFHYRASCRQRASTTCSAACAGPFDGRCCCWDGSRVDHAAAAFGTRWRLRTAPAHAYPWDGPLNGS